LRIRDREIVGFALHVDGLGATDSLRLQATGIGGRRRFGCGVFAPTKTQGLAL
jgi:CRISPR-associated endonuclease/helicase Cas3